MVVTELGIVTHDRALQPENAYLPMVVTELGMATLDSLVCPYAKNAGIRSTLFPILTVEIFFEPSKTKELKSEQETALKLSVCK